MGFWQLGPWFIYRSRRFVTTRGLLPRVTTRGLLPRVTARGLLPRVKTCGLLPRVTTCGLLPRVTTRGLLPRVTTRGLLPRVTTYGLLPRVVTNLPQKTQHASDDSDNKPAVDYLYSSMHHDQVNPVGSQSFLFHILTPHSLP
jgi:hypothetical protein